MNWRPIIRKRSTPKKAKKNSKILLAPNTVGYWWMRCIYKDDPNYWFWDIVRLDRYHNRKTLYVLGEDNNLTKVDGKYLGNKYKALEEFYTEWIGPIKAPDLDQSYHIMYQ